VYQLVRIKILAIILLLLSPSLVCSEEYKARLEIAIAPFLPVKTLVQNYAPMRDYLQSKLNEPVTIISAPDYKTYYKRIKNREYPIIITVASSAYLAWAESSYIPLLRPLVYTRPVLVIAKDQPNLQPADLRGKTIAMSDTLAIVSMQGLQMLRDAGLKPGIDVTIKNLPNHGAAVNHVISGDVSAAIVSDRALMQMPISIQNKIIVAYTWDKGAAPGIVYLGSPNLPREKLEQIKKAIHEFAQQSPEGIKLMNAMGYGGLASIGPEDLRSLEPYGALLKKAIARDP
jgi:ABC-type phosphate/phosphonate transport system substrate-binding protein